MRCLRYFFMVLLLPLQCFSQQDSTFSRSGESSYLFNWKKDLIVASAAGLLAVGGEFAQYRVKPLTLARINALDRNKQPSFDRSAMDNWNPTIAKVSDGLLYASFSLPLVMMINKKARKDFLVVGFIYAQVAMFTYGLTGFAKSLVKRPRPYVYNPSVDLKIRTSRDARFSFFSGHTSMPAALSFATAKIFSDYSRNPTHKALVWAGAALFPAAVGYLRFEAGKHFPSDIVVGYLVGASIGYLIPWLHTKKPLGKGVNLVPYSNGENEVGIYFSYRL